MKMTIGKKLLMSYVIIIVMVLIAGISAIYYMGQVHQGLIMVAEENNKFAALADLQDS